METRKQILRSLMEFYPLNVDEVVIVSAVQKVVGGTSASLISSEIQSLKDKGWVEESWVKAPFSHAKTRRFKITSSGIEQLQSTGEGKTGDLSERLSMLEARLVAGLDQIRSEMEVLQRDMEQDKRKLEEPLERVARNVTDLSQELMAIKKMVDAHTEKFESNGRMEEQLILRVLSGDERAIYETILNNGGTMLQKDLIARTRMSNSKVSRTIDHLEGRGVLAKERHGATNRLRLLVRPRA